ncbi:hypothetical protein V8V91_07225 [Algoriphagus halophilus]|uniref:TolB family protein n=1 Tax=Algoriphagus halophilus TaxID=226505 RepID=UPI00358DF7E4
MRGGDHGGGNASSTVNAQNLPVLPKVEIWKINLSTQQLEVVAEADAPIFGPPHQLLFLKGGQVWSANLDNSEKPSQLFEIKGNINELSYSPDGKQLAFVVNRSSHSMIGIYQNPETPIQWVAPSFHRDSNIHWSPDGKKIAFIRRPGEMELHFLF